MDQQLSTKSVPTLDESHMVPMEGSYRKFRAALEELKHTYEVFKPADKKLSGMHDSGQPTERAASRLWEAVKGVVEI